MSRFRCIGIAAVDEIWRCRATCRYRFEHQVMIRRSIACRIGMRGVAGQCERLAPAATPVDLSLIAGPARLRHPGSAPEPRECRRIIPNRAERLIEHRRKV